MTIVEKPEKNLVTVAEIAEELGLNQETVRRAIRDRKLPARKIGNMLFVEAHDLRAYKRQRAARTQVGPVAGG